MKTNRKLMVSLCGLALSSVFLINNKAVVHADSLNNDDQSNAITWDSDKTQSADSTQTQETPANSKPVQHSAVQYKVSRVEASQQAPVTKTKVAQFNQNSQIYGLNNNSELSKTNGDGYVITNAGTYKGRKVDIGVTINNIQDNQGTYTTKWSNGDKADVTGKVDNQFNYQNSVLVGTTSQQPQVDQNKKHTRIINQIVDFPSCKITLGDIHISNDSPKGDGYDGGVLISTGGQYGYDITNSVISNYETNDLASALEDAIADYVYNNNSRFYSIGEMHFFGHYDGSGIEWLSTDIHEGFRDLDEIWPDEDYLNKWSSQVKSSHNDREIVPLGFTAKTNEPNHYIYGLISIRRGKGKYKINKQKSITDYLKLDQVNNGSLNYNYTVGVYDAETGELIDSLLPEYKGLKGVRATNSDTAMNTAIKNKINQINQNKAIAAYTGTKANDDVAFYIVTRKVDPASDARLRAVATRTIQIKFPDGVVPKSYDKVCDSTGLIKQTVQFTRSGTENLANGKMTFGAWQSNNQDPNFLGFPERTLPRIPGYTLSIKPA